MAGTMSIQTEIFIKRWNASNLQGPRERLIKNHLAKLFLKKDLIAFLEEFTNQFLFVQDGKRVKILLLCRKLIIQYPAQIDKAHYNAFREEYDFEIANDTSVNPVTWINEEISYTKGLKDIDNVFSPNDYKANQLDGNIAIADIHQETYGLMKLDEILKHFGWSKATFDRRRAEGFPAFNIEKKIYVERIKAMSWRPGKPNQIQLHITKRR